MVKMVILINSDSGDCVFSGDSGIYGYFSESNNFCNVVFLVNLVNLVILMTLVIW